MAFSSLPFVQHGFLSKRETARSLVLVRILVLWTAAQKKFFFPNAPETLPATACWPRSLRTLRTSLKMLLLGYVVLGWPKRRELWEREWCLHSLSTVVISGQQSAVNWPQYSSFTDFCVASILKLHVLRIGRNSVKTESEFLAKNFRQKALNERKHTGNIKGLSFMPTPLKNKVPYVMFFFYT